MLESAEDYFPVNRGVVRRPIIPLGAPALVQNYIFWKPAGRDRDAWHNDIDKILWNILVHALPKGVLSGTTKPDEYFTALEKEFGFKCRDFRPDEKRIELFFHQIDMQSIADSIEDGIRQAWGKIDYDSQRSKMDGKNRVIRYENFSFSIKFTFMGLTFKLVCFAEQRSEFWTLTFVGDFSGISIGDSEKTETEALFAPASDGFNSLLLNSILNPVSRIISADNKLSLQYYGDFRGVVLARQQKSRGTSNSTVSNWIKLGPEVDAVGVSKLMANQNTWSVGSSGGGSSAGRARSDGEFDPFATGYAEQVVDELWPYLFETFKRDSINEFEPNLAVTKILSRRLIHISSLGIAGSSSSDASQQTPVRFVLVTSTKNEWTLGHAIERVTNLGTMRLAALKDIQKLQEFSDKLDELNAAWQKFKKKTGEDQTTLSKIQAELQAAVDLIEGGVLDRISRSAYWADLFGQIQTGLGMDNRSDKSVAEFQSYDDFVRRRLGATFEFIRRLRIRYNNLHEAIKSELDTVSAENLSKLKENSVQSVEEIRTVLASLKEPVNALNGNSAEQKSLLEMADNVLPIIIVYYLSSIFHHLGFDSWALGDFSPSGENAASHWYDGMFSFLVATGVTLFIFRKRLIYRLLKRVVDFFKGPPN